MVGLAAWIAAAPKLGLPPTGPVELALATLGALLPDIDHPKSWVGRRLAPVSRPLARLFGHRGFTHSLLALVLCAYALRVHGVSRAVTVPLAVGFASHLGADLLTPAGVRPFWPWRRRFALPFCRTGSPAEQAIVLVLVTWLAIRLLRRYGLRLLG